MLLCEASGQAQDPIVKTSSVQSQEDATIELIRTSSEQIANAFNTGKVDDLSAMFLAKGELIDEFGNVYAGEQEIKSVLVALFTRYPGATVAFNVESIRIAGPVAIEEGTRTISSKDNTESTPLRYLMVWAKTDNGWKIASQRDFSNDAAPTSNDYLQPISWLEGDWINEGVDGKVAITFNWSEDKNYLLGEFNIESNGAVPRKSSQRIGWDANAGKIRSWLFDPDGGFSEGDAIVLANDKQGSIAGAVRSLGADKWQFTLSGSPLASRPMGFCPE
jgi:uncharacterized protein (TIGR02246 family)